MNDSHGRIIKCNSRFQGRHGHLDPGLLIFPVMINGRKKFKKYVFTAESAKVSDSVWAFLEVYAFYLHGTGHPDRFAAVILGGAVMVN